MGNNERVLLVSVVLLEAEQASRSTAGWNVEHRTLWTSMEIQKLCKGGHRLSSYEGNQKVIKKLCDLEKIAFVGWESVESDTEEESRDGHTASCQLGFTECKHPSCSTWYSYLHTWRTSERAKRSSTTRHVLFYFSVTPLRLQNIASGEPALVLVQSSDYYPCRKAIGTKCIPNWIQYDCKIDLLLTNYAFPMQFITQQCLQ